MTPMPRDEKVFAQLRQLAPELSREKVGQIIAILPTLPPPSSGWFSSIHLNSILMTTTIISTLTVLSFYLFTSSPSAEITVANESLTISQESEKIASLVEDEQTKEVFQNIDNQVVSVTDTIVPPSAPQRMIEPKKELTKVEKVEPVAPNILEPQREKILLIEPDVNLPKDDLVVLEDTLDPSIFDKEPLQIFPDEPKPIVNADWEASICEDKVDFTGNIKLFKNRLLKKLAKDGLIKSSKQKMRCYFTDKAVVVNEQMLSQELAGQYRNFLATYSIYSCAQRIIETTREYIIIGDMSNTGFSGRMSGRADIDALNKIPKSPLLKDAIGQKESRPIQGFHTLKVSGVAVVYLTETDKAAARLEVAGMPLSDVVTQQKNGVLTITTKGRPSGESIKVYVGSSNLRSIEVGGAAKLYSTQTVSANDLTIRVLDAAAAWLEVAVNDLGIILQGGDLHIKGAATTRKIKNLDSQNRGILNDSNLLVSSEIEVDLVANPCDGLLKVSRYDLERLEEELQDLLRNYRIIYPAQLTFSDYKGQQIKLNQEALSEQQSEDFVDLLKQYDVYPCPDRSITVGKKFIAVGDVSTEGFRGTVLGKEVLLNSKYGKIDLNIGSGYQTLNQVSWGSKLELK